MLGTWLFLAINLVFAVILFLQQDTVLTVIGVFLILEGLVYLGWSYREERKTKSGQQEGGVEPGSQA